MSSNKLDEIVNDAYKFFFNPSKKNFKTKSVLINEVLNDNNLFKYDRTNDFVDELLDSLFNSDVKLVSADSDKVVFTRKNSENDNKSLVTLFFFKNTESADTISNEINVNAINRFVLYTNSGKLSYVTLPIINFDIGMNKIKSKLESFDEVSKVLKKNKSTIVSVQLTGNFYKTEDIKSILKELNNDDLQVMLFELIYGVFHHQRKYPELRLNFNSLDSLMLYSRKPSDRSFHYFVNDNHFQVKDIGLKLKFHDLRNSVIHKDINNSSLSAKQKKYSQTDDLVNLLDLFKSVATKDNKKMIDTLIKDIKKNEYNAESVLVSSSMFANLKDSKPVVDSTPEQDNMDMQNGLPTSSIGGADLLDLDDDDSDSDSSSSESDLLSLGGGNDDDSSSSEKMQKNDDTELDLDEDEDDNDNKDENKNNTDTDDLLSLDDMSTDVEYSNEKKDKKDKKDLKKENEKELSEELSEEDHDDNTVQGNRKLHSGLTEDIGSRGSESSLMSLSFSDRSVKNKSKKTPQNGEKKSNRLGDLLGAKNIRPPEGRNLPNYNSMQQNSVADVFQQKMNTNNLPNYNSMQQMNTNNLANDGYNVLSPSSIPDVNEGLDVEMAKVRNSMQQNMNGQSNLPQNMNGQSNLPPYMQQELNRINPNIMQGQMPMNNNFNQKMPMNSVHLDQGLPNNMQMPMNGQMPMQMPMNGQMPMQMDGQMPMQMPMQMDGQMPMQMDGQMPMQMPMNGQMPMQMPMQMHGQMQGNLPNLNQTRVNDILNKYGPNYNGPIDMMGGSNQVELEYLLNDNLSSGQKKKTKSIKNEGTKQIGGSGRIIPKYVGTKNTPFKTQDTKNIEKTRYNEIPSYVKDAKNAGPDPFVEFKVNPSVLGSQKPINQALYPSAYVPVQNQYVPQNFPYVTGSGMHNMNPYSFVPNNVPVIQNYNISMPNPAGDHVKLADLYEDMLPQNENNYKNTSMTLNERLITYNYVRSILVRIGDGEDIEISGKIGTSTNRKNLLSYLKLLDLNPYHNSKISQNPYNSLPEKMLMYRSCYPIRWDAAKNKTTCSKYSIGLNLRIYEMSVAEYNVKKMFYDNEDNDRKDIKLAEFNLWREIAFYEFTREEILKKKICPHFPMMYSWFISTGSDVDFKKLRLIKNKYGKEISKADISTARKIADKYKDALNKHLDSQLLMPLGDIEKLPVLPKNGPAPHLGAHTHNFTHTHSDRRSHSRKELSHIHNSLAHPRVFEDKPKPIDVYYQGHDRFQVDLNSSVNRCLLALTEAPNYNIRQWATKTYEHQMIGPVKKMIQTGYHHATVWFSIMFQILISLQVMYMKKFTFIDMTLEDNIFIKDLMNNEQALGYWKYIFKGFEYYVPNHGYLVMIDSNYKDIKNNDNTFVTRPDNDEDKEKMKMYGSGVDQDFEYFDDSGDITDKGKKLDELQYKNLQNLLNPANFGNIHTNYGGIKPDVEVIRILTKIHKIISDRSPDKKNGDLTDVIIEMMGMFVHNRTGTALSTTEFADVISRVPIANPVPGQLYAYNVRDELYAWVIFISDNGDGKCEVLSRNNYKDSEDVLKRTISRADLFEYSSLTNVEQKYKPQETKLSEDELLEIYNVN